MKIINNNPNEFGDGVLLTQKRKAILMMIMHRSLLIIAMGLILFPLYWALTGSLRPLVDVFVGRPGELQYFPREVTLDAYRSVLLHSSFPRYFLNTLVYTAGVVGLTVSISTLGGYGLTRLDLPAKVNFARLILFGYMFSPILLAIPMYILWSELGLVNNVVGVILALTASILPFNLWIMWKFFQTVPVSLEESAQMSGATRFQAFYQIALPLAKPGVIAVALFSYSSSWGAYTIPLILAPNPEMYHFTVGIEEFTRSQRVQIPELYAASIMVIIPSLIFGFVLQKYLLRGFKI